MRQPPAPPVLLTRADGAAPARLRVADLVAPEPACWHVIEVSHDPQRSPALECTVDGEPVELEPGPDGWLRPRRTGGDG